MKKYYVYVGYYEVFITTHELPAPYFVASRHKNATLATKRVEKDWPSASVYYDEESYVDFFYDHTGLAVEMPEPLFGINGIKFYE